MKKRRRNRCQQCGQRHGKGRKRIVRIADGYAGPSLEWIVSATPVKVRRFVFLGEPPRIVHRGEAVVDPCVSPSSHALRIPFSDVDPAVDLQTYASCLVRQDGRDLGWIGIVHGMAYVLHIAEGSRLRSGSYEIVELPRTDHRIWTAGRQNDRRLCIHYQGIAFFGVDRSKGLS